MSSEALISWIVSGSLLLSACSSGNDSGGGGAPSGLARTDLINVMLHTPDAGVSVVAGGTYLASGLDYRYWTTRSLIVWEGAETVKDLDFLITSSGTGETILGPEVRPVEDGVEYATVVLGDLLEDDESPLYAQLLFFAKDYRPPQPDAARAVFVHAMPGQPAVDIRIRGGAGTETVATRLGYGGLSDYAGFTPALGARSRLTVTRAGRDPGGDADLIDLEDVSFIAGQIYIVLLIYDQKQLGPLTELTAEILDQL